MPANPRANVTRKVGGDVVDLDDTQTPQDGQTSGTARVLGSSVPLATQATPTRTRTRLAGRQGQRTTTGGPVSFSQAGEQAGARLAAAKTGTSRRPTPLTDQDQNQTTAGVSDAAGTAGQLAPKNNATQSQNNRQPVTSVSALEIKSALTDLSIPENPLLDFVDLQYHLLLSLVPEPNVKDIQRRIPVGAQPRNVGSFDELQRAIQDEGAIPLASTGDVFFNEFSEFQSTDQFGTAQNVVRRFADLNYYNIESMSFDNAMSPTAANPFVNAMLTGKLVLVEPHGFKFKEDIIKMGNAIGYRDINPGRFMYRIDIFFSGYNQDTGEWIPFVEMDVRTRRTKILTYYVNFTTVEAKVAHTGTTYDISFAPSGHVAYRPEEIIINSGAIVTGDQARSEKFGAFLARLATAMETAVRERTHEQVKRKYEFKAPPQLLDADFFTGNFESKKNFISNDPKKGSFVTPARDVNVISLVEEALQDIAFVWNEFLKKDDKRHLTPRIHWGIRFNVIFDSSANPGTGDYEEITIQYIIDPFVTYKNMTVNNREELQLVIQVDSQARRVEQMLQFGMINRVYDYINTPENLEVIELDIALKNFYYHTMYKPRDTAAGVGVSQSEGADSQSRHRTGTTESAKERGTNSSRQPTQVPRSQENSLDSALRRIFGRQVDSATPACDTSTFQSVYDRYGGGFGEMPTSDYRSMVGSSDNPLRDEYQANINDHIKNDLIKIEMQVRGDPQWLLTPYGVDSGNVLATADQTNNVEGPTALVQPQSSRCFFLRMFAPTQEDYMNPDRMDASTACSVIGGFYEVITVTSNFEGGKFTQTLSAAKMHHLNYVENFIGVASNDRVDTRVPDTNSEIPARAQQPAEEPRTANIFGTPIALA